MEEERDDEWPPPDARYRSALWRAEGHIERGEWGRAADALEDILGLGDDEVVRGLLHLAAAGYRSRTAIVSGRQSSWTTPAAASARTCPSTKRSISTR